MNPDTASPLQNTPAPNCPEALHLTRPDDWHVHLRDGAALGSVAVHTAAQFARALVMPNLTPPITTLAQAQAYRERILQALPEGVQFQPIPALYLTDHTDPAQMAQAKAAGVLACKLYPAGATTNSDAGVTRMQAIYPVLQAMQKHGLLLLLHGEVTTPEVDIFDREARFIEDVLVPLQRDFPALKVVLEHITTQQAAQYVHQASPNTAATITPQHLLLNRNAIFSGGLRPHHYCLPILKRERHRLALVQAATSGCPKFFLGTDSAPHASMLKEAAVGCAGCYTAPLALALYATAFAAQGALDKLEAFAAFYGADFYGVPRNTGRITLTRESWQVPQTYAFGNAQVQPLFAGQTLHWKLQGGSQ